MQAEKGYMVSDGLSLVACVKEYASAYGFTEERALARLADMGYRRHLALHRNKHGNADKRHPAPGRKGKAGRK